MELLPAIRKSIIAFALLPALLYAGIPPTLQSDASQRMTILLIQMKIPLFYAVRVVLVFIFWYHNG